PDLRDPLGDRIRVALLLVGVFEIIFGHSVGVDSRRHVVVAIVAKHTHDFGRERLVEYRDDFFTVREVTLRHRAILNMLASAAPDLLDVRQRRPFLDGRFTALPARPSLLGGPGRAGSPAASLLSTFRLSPLLSHVDSPSALRSAWRRALQERGPRKVDLR